MQTPSVMTVMLSILFSALVATAVTDETCVVQLAGRRLPAAQIELARQLVHGAFPNVGAITAVRLADFAAGVRDLNLPFEQVLVFGNLVPRILNSPRVAMAPPESALGRAARRLRATAERDDALTVCMPHRPCARESLVLFSSRGSYVGHPPAGGRGAPTLRKMTLDGVEQAPSPHAVLLIEPMDFGSPDRFSDLAQSLLKAMSTFDVMLTITEWAEANRANLAEADRPDELKYLTEAGEEIVIDVGFAQILMYAQQASVRLALADRAQKHEIQAELLTQIDSYPSSRDLARRLKINKSPARLIEFAERTLERIRSQR